MYMHLTLSVDDQVVESARQRAKALGASVDQLVREYLEQLAGKADPEADAAEFEKLSRLSAGNSRGWKFDHDEVHERR